GGNRLPLSTLLTCGPAVTVQDVTSSERCIALDLGHQTVLDEVAALCVGEGGQVHVRTDSMVAGSVVVAKKPGWGKTVALGVVGVVPAVLYRTLGTKHS